MASEQKPPMSKAIREFFAQQGAKGGKIGGKRSAAKLTPEERSQRARNAALARWNKSPSKSTD